MSHRHLAKPYLDRVDFSKFENVLSAKMMSQKKNSVP
jgi:hypothetical protein